MFGRWLAGLLVASAILVGGAAATGDGAVWIATGGTGSTSFATALAKAPGGGVYAVIDEQDHLAVSLARLDGAGHALWQRALGTHHYPGDAALASARDGGVAVLVGLSRRGVRGELVLVRFGPDGDPRWRRAIMATASPKAADRSIGIAVAPSGEITIAGTLAPRADLAEPSMVVARFDGDGRREWQTVRAQKRGFANGLAIGGDGTIYVAERQNRVAAYSPSGEFTWERRMRGALIQDLEAAPDGVDVLIDHATYAEAGLTVVRLSPNGRQQHVMSLGHAGSEDPAGLARASNGNLLVAGSTSSTRFLRHITNGDHDFFVVEMGPSGRIAGSAVFGAEDEEFSKAVLSTDEGLFMAGATSSRSLAGDELEWLGWLVVRQR